MVSTLRFADTLVLEASPTEVWNLLLDVDHFSACIPGVQQVTPVDDRTFDGTILATVGPISGTFRFRASILESQPLEALSARVEGNDSVTRSRVQADMHMALNPLDAQRTELAYRTTVDVDGRMAILGDMVLRATGTVMLQEFGKRLRRQLERA